MNRSFVLWRVLKSLHLHHKLFYHYQEIGDFVRSLIKVISHLLFLQLGVTTDVPRLTDIDGVLKFSEQIDELIPFFLDFPVP